MDDAVRTAEDGVVLQFESASGRIFRAEHIADGALGQRTEGTPTGVELLPVEAALKLRQLEHRQVFNLGEGAIVDTLIPDGPVLAALVMALSEVGLELCRRLRREDAVQSLGYGVEFDIPQRVVASCLQRVEVHVNLELRQRRCHELSIATEDISAHRLYLHAVLLLSRRHGHPVVPLAGHDIESFCHHGNGTDGNEEAQQTIARDYLLIVEFTAHLSGTSII